MATYIPTQCVLVYFSCSLMLPVHMSCFPRWTPCPCVAKLYPNLLDNAWHRVDTCQLLKYLWNIRWIITICWTLMCQAHYMCYLTTTLYIKYHYYSIYKCRSWARRWFKWCTKCCSWDIISGHCLRLSSLWGDDVSLQVLALWFILSFLLCFS